MGAEAAIQRRDPREYYVPAWRADPNFKPWVPTQLMWEQCDAKRRRALRVAWKAGDLSYKLDPEQLKVYRKIRAWMALPPDKRGSIFCLDVSRRWGKSSIMFLIAVEERLRNGRRRRVAYWTDTGRMVEEIIMLEVYPWLFDDCPPEFRPEWYPSRHRIIWDQDHKSLDQCRSLELAGLDDPNRARGRSLYFGVVDEAAFITNLEYIDKSVISKMMITIPESALLMGSTPPISPTHYWSTELCRKAEAEDAYHHGTIFDNPRLSDQQIMREIEKTGGLHHTATRRELYAEHIMDETMAVLPEADEAYKAGTLTLDVEAPVPSWRNCYTAMDPGWSDATGILFAYIDFDRQKLVIEDEWLATQAATGIVAEAVSTKERELWHAVPRWTRKNGGERAQNPHRRWTDVDKRLTWDLANDHGLLFQPTEKIGLDQQIVRVRNWILDRKIEVHPRCVKLISQMRHAVYKNELRRQFAREGAFGHFDLVAALVYLCRNAEPLLRRNPNPPQYYGEDLRERFTGHLWGVNEQSGRESGAKRERGQRQFARANHFRGRKRSV